MVASLVGLHSWSGSRDDKGHRSYRARWLAVAGTADGPESVSGVAGLPTVGTAWLIGTDSDPYAFCTPSLTLTPFTDGELNDLWWIDQTFSTQPLEQNQNKDPNNPLTWTPEVSGSFVKFTRAAVEDKDGDPLLSTSFERFKGASVEVDDCRHQIVIKMFLSSLPLTTYCEYINTVNTNTMWGLTARKVKLSNVSWKVLLYGSSWASKYYEVTYEFDIDFNTFDRKILDEGTKVLKAGGTVTNMADYEPYLLKGQPSPVLLKADGNPIAVEADAHYFTKKLYKENNLLLLGVPTSF